MFSSTKSSSKPSVLAKLLALLKPRKSSAPSQRASVLYPEDSGEDYFAFVPAVEIVHTTYNAAAWTPTSFFLAHSDVDCPSPSASSFTDSSTSDSDDDLPLPAPYRPWLKNKSSRPSSKSRRSSSASFTSSSRTSSSRSTSSSSSSSSLRHEIVAPSVDVIADAPLPNTNATLRRPTATRLSWTSQRIQDNDIHNLFQGELFDYLQAVEKTEPLDVPRKNKKRLLSLF